MVQSDVKITMNGDYNNDYDEWDYVIWKEEESNDLDAGTSYNIDKRAPYVKIFYIEWRHFKHETKKKSRVLKKHFYVHVIGERNYVSVIMDRLYKHGIKLDNISYEIK